jgi:hypothetical protein
MKDVVFFKWLLKKDGKLQEQEAVPLSDIVWFIMT